MAAAIADKSYQVNVNQRISLNAILWMVEPNGRVHLYVI